VDDTPQGLRERFTSISMGHQKEAIGRFFGDFSELFGSNWHKNVNDSF
jgi:hypothetical protein